VLESTSERSVDVAAADVAGVVTLNSTSIPAAVRDDHAHSLPDDVIINDDVTFTSGVDQSGVPPASDVTADVVSAAV